MSPEELEAWLLERPALIIYVVALMAGSLVSFLLLLRRLLQSRRLGATPVSPWPLRPLDFGLFMSALVIWFALSGAFLMQAYKWIAGADVQPGPGIIVLGGFLLQAGMLYLFLRFRFHYRSPNEGPLSPRLLSTRQSLLTGLFYFLASLPVVYGVGVAWNTILQMLRDRGVDISLPLQDAVVLFRQTDSAAVLVGLVLLAVVVAPVVEETVFRAGIFRFLKGRAPLSIALLVSGTLFGLVHANLQSLPGLITVGVFLGLAYEHSGNLKVPIFFHAFFNLNSIIWILLIPEGLAG
jgi:membrane protease YdiL (CAAX protease family)